MSASFPKRARILKGSDYSSVLKRPQRKLTKGAVQVKVRANGLACARLGLVVPKRGTAKAHDRNRLKRVIRDQFRLIRNSLPAEDIVVQVFREVAVDTLKQTLKQQFSTLADGDKR